METNLDVHFKTNPSLEKDGVDFALDDKTSFRVRRFNSQNPRVKAAMTAYYKPYARQVELGTLPQDKSDEITMKLFIDVCLASWMGVEDKKGQPIECNKENALKLFKSLPDLFESLWKYANSFENYKEEVGNSLSATSDGLGAGKKN